MSTIWRRVVPFVLAGGLITAGAIPAEAASSATASYGVTISATSPHYPGAVKGKVDGHALVIYKAGSQENTATISGNVTGAVSGDVATLLSEPFGATGFTSTGVTLSLTGAPTQAYSFPVQPSLATQYEVQVTTGATTDQTSGAQTVYVTEGHGNRALGYKWKCTHNQCKVTYTLPSVLAAAAYNAEAGKRWYLYLAVDPSFPRHLPRFLPIDKRGSASKARKISATEFEVTFTFRFTSHVRRAGKYAISVVCTKDSESKDGLGLPGTHGCGSRRLSIFAPYVG